jgi:hypothetical protein
VGAPFVTRGQPAYGRAVFIDVSSIHPVAVARVVRRAGNAIGWQAGDYGELFR